MKEHISIQKGLLIVLAFALAFAGQANQATAAEEATEVAILVRDVITGKVTDVNGAPIPGASVKVKGTTVVAITDADGRFKISANAGDVLLVSSIGSQPQEIAINGQKEISVLLKEDSQTLNELVVVGYGKQKKINLSGAVDGITAKEIENRPIANLGAGLQGLIPNLNVSIGSGRATDAPGFNIRGVTSLSGGSPYILVDNVPYTSTELSLINPNDIESVTVLKDAASAAIYGARAAFGVVLITTKTAKGDQLNVSANSYYALKTVGRLPELVTDPFTVMTYKHDAAYPLYNLYTGAILDYAKKRSADLSLPAVYIDPASPTTWQNVGNTNWLKEAYNNNSPSYNANFSLSKRAEKLNYYISTEYMRTDGALKDAKESYDRYNLRAKADLKVLNWLNVENNTAFVSSYYQVPYVAANDFFWNVNRQPSLDPVYNPDGTYTNSGAAVIGRLKEGGHSMYRTNNFQTTFSATANVIKNVLQLKADATFRRNAQINKSNDFPVSYYTGPNTAAKLVGSNPSFAQVDNGETRNNLYNVYADFHKTFNKHDVQALVGFNQEYRYAGSTSVNRKILISNNLPAISLATGDVTASESITDWAVRGLFYRLNYIYDDKYILELNGRYDGTSRFPSGDRWGFFPSASASWVLTNEKFVKTFANNIHLDLFKLRASYGNLGNQDVGAYSYIATMGSGQIASILDGTRPTAVYAPGAISPSLTWEKVSTVNFGVDMGWFGNRLELNFDKFTRYTKGMLTKGKTLPGVFGTAEPTINAANLKTKGWELRLGWKDAVNIASSPLTYNVGLNLSDNRTFITKYDNPTGTLSDYYVGKELGEIWGLETEGFFQSEAELKSHADQTAVGADDTGYKFYVGDLKFKDQNGDNKINKGKNTLSDHGDLVRIGNSSARYRYGVDVNLGWKGFDLRAFFQGVGKQDWYPNPSNIYFWGVYAQPWTNVTVQNLDHWSTETPNAYFPRLKAYIAEDATELGQAQTKYLQDASYLRLKNLTVGYTFPKAISSKLRINRLRIYFSGENILDRSHIKGNLDPEALGGDVYPFQKTYSFGLNLTL